MHRSRILLIPGYQLYPISTGAGVAQYGIIDELRKYHQVHLLLDEHNVAAAYQEELREQWPDVHFKFWDDLLAIFQTEYRPSLFARLKAKLIPKSAHTVPDFQLPEGLQGIWDNATFFLRAKDTWRTEVLDHHLTKQSYDLVQTDLPVNLKLIRKSYSPAKTLHVCHELKSKRFRTGAEQSKAPEASWQSAYQYLRRQELDALARYDATIVFTEEDKAELMSLKGHKVEISPFPILDSEFENKEGGSPRRLVFLGPEHHGPNAEGLRWFLQEVYQEEMPIEVVGEWSQESIKELGSPHVRFHGFVDELDPLFESSVMVVPVRSGAGIRTKILQAMARKVPVLSTEFAAEGIAHQGLILGFQDRATYGERLAQLNNTEELNAMTARAQAYVASTFSQSVLGKKRSSLIQGIIENR